MPGETTTPNIGLQIAAFDQANWQVPTTFNWNLLDQIFGGEVTVPALSVEVLTAGNAGDFTLPPAVAETPVGAVPGTVYTLSQTPSPAAMLSFYVNGVLQRMGGLDATLTGNIVTLNSTTSSGDTVYATYFYAA
jgi:hypothetical protein